MLMLRRTHERLMAAKDVELANIRGHFSAILAAERKDYTELVQRMADFADRSLPPPRITSVQQPKSITEADTNAAKKLRGMK